MFRFLNALYIGKNAFDSSQNGQHTFLLLYKILTAFSRHCWVEKAFLGSSGPLLFGVVFSV